MKLVNTVTLEQAQEYAAKLLHHFRHRFPCAVFYACIGGEWYAAANLSELTKLAISAGMAEMTYAYHGVMPHQNKTTTSPTVGGQGAPNA